MAGLKQAGHSLVRWEDVERWYQQRPIAATPAMSHRVTSESSPQASYSSLTRNQSDPQLGSARLGSFSARDARSGSIGCVRRGAGDIITRQSRARLDKLRKTSLEPQGHAANDTAAAEEIRKLQRMLAATLADLNAYRCAFQDLAVSGPPPAEVDVAPADWMRRMSHAKALLGPEEEHVSDRERLVTTIRQLRKDKEAALKKAREAQQAAATAESEMRLTRSVQAARERELADLREKVRRLGKDKSDLMQQLLKRGEQLIEVKRSRELAGSENAKLRMELRKRAERSQTEILWLREQLEGRGDLTAASTSDTAFVASDREEKLNGMIADLQKALDESSSEYEVLREAYVGLAKQVQDQLDTGGDPSDSISRNGRPQLGPARALVNGMDDWALQVKAAEEGEAEAWRQVDEKEREIAQMRDEMERMRDNLAEMANCIGASVSPPPVASVPSDDATKELSGSARGLATIVEDSA